MPQSPQGLHRFLALDGLRGAAALVVLAFHLLQQRDLTALPLAGLAVDFFYTLSGFVIAFAYEQKLRSGRMRLPVFLWVRVERLYPLLLLGTLMGIAPAMLAVAFKGTITYHQVASSSVLALLLLPSYVFPQWDTAYPLNMASWSLTFELVANAIYAIMAPSLTLRRLVQLTFCSAILLIIVAYVNNGVAGGNNQDNFVYGFGRVLYPFFVGVLLFRLRLSWKIDSRTGILLTLALVGLLLAPVHDSGLTSVIYVLVIFPVVVGIGANVQPSAASAKIFRLFGNLSYPIYILQGPILRLGEEMLRHWQLTSPEFYLFTSIEGLVVLVFSYVAFVAYDVPLRSYLTLRYKQKLAIGVIAGP
jgi:peptidoglycan/LPS O-acetylase OafA/YrhL